MASDGRIIKNAINSFNTFNEGSTAMKRKRERDIATAIATGRALAPVPYGGEVPVRPEPQMALPPTFPDAVGITQPAPVPVAAVTQSAIPPSTVEETVANKVNTALTEGGRNGTDIGNYDRRAQMASTLMGGNMGEFIQKLLRATLQPEFQQPGFGGLGQVMLGATNALRAVDTQDIEAAKLEAAEQDRAAKLQATQASVANKAAVDQMRLDMEKERLGLARKAALGKETQDLAQRGKLTKAELEGLQRQIEGDPQIQALMEALDGTGFGRLIGTSPSTESVTGYITSRVVELRAADPSISVRDAAIQAADELAVKATNTSAGSTPVKPAPGGVDKFKGEVGR